MDARDYWMFQLTDQISNSLDPQVLENFGPLDKFALCAAFSKCGLRRYPDVLGDPQGERTSQECVCSVCGQLYGDHPMDWRVIGYGDVPFLHVLCDGRRVKL